MNGQPITAAHVRELLAQLDAVCPGGLQAPTGGSLQVAVTDADGALLATASRRSWSGSPAAAAPTIPETARLPAAAVRCSSRPPPVDRYRPTPGAAPLRQDPGPHLPASRLRAAGRPGRPRPRRPVCRGGRDRLRQPVLPVPPAPPAQDLRPGLAVRPHRRRPAAGHHAERDHPHHPATGPARPHRATRPARTSPAPRGTAAVLRRHRADARRYVRKEWTEVKAASRRVSGSSVGA